jgi:uncharacterized protein (DUF4415 family)
MNAKSKKSNPPWTDPDDAPEVTDGWVQQATLYDGAKAVRRGRPKAASPKEPIKIRLDADVLEALRLSGDGWQTRVNDTLRASLKLAGKLH